MPLPVPFPPPETSIQLLAPETLHGQPAPALTATLPDPPDDPNDALDEASEKVHAAAACVTVKDSPAIVSVPLRLVVLLLAAAEKETTPLPRFAPPPAENVSQLTLLAADHGHPDPAVTVAFPDPPDAPNDRVTAETAASQMDWKENSFEGALVPEPPGPMATTRTSYSAPGAGSGRRIVESSTRMVPCASGSGLPSGATRIGSLDPTAYSMNSYRVTNGTPFGLVLS